MGCPVCGPLGSKSKLFSGICFSERHWHFWSVGLCLSTIQAKRKRPNSLSCHFWGPEVPKKSTFFPSSNWVFLCSFYILCSGFPALCSGKNIGKYVLVIILEVEVSYHFWSCSFFFVRTRNVYVLISPFAKVFPVISSLNEACSLIKKCWFTVALICMLFLRSPIPIYSSCLSKVVHLFTHRTWRYFFYFEEYSF